MTKRQLVWRALAALAAVVVALGLMGCGGTTPVLGTGSYESGDLSLTGGGKTLVLRNTILVLNPATALATAQDSPTAAFLAMVDTNGDGEADGLLELDGNYTVDGDQVAVTLQSPTAQSSPLSTGLTMSLEIDSSERLSGQVSCDWDGTTYAGRGIFQLW